MRKYAILNDNVVTDVRDLQDGDVAEYARGNSLVVDVTDNLLPPSIGWVLDGNMITPPPGEIYDIKKMVQNRIKFYRALAEDVLSELYAENTLTGLTDAQSDAMFDECADILLRIREGAWPTALYRLNHKQPTTAVTQEALDRWIAILQSKMV